jgi:polysaccharide deacetylase family protein (PEP-CTERM system associated)
MIAHGLSFDVEEYFHALNLRAVAPVERWDSMERRVAATTREILDQLARHEVTATFFVLGWVGERDPELVREIAARGHEVGSHGMSHQMANELGEAAFRAEARASKAILEDAIGAPVLGFRASTFSITAATSWALHVLREEGYAYDSSVFPVRHDRYGWPAFPRDPVNVESRGGDLLELPMLTLRRFGTNLPAAGGGYLRLLPLGLMHRALDDAASRGAPGMLYLHPWEFDPGQPRLLARGLAALRHYRGLEGTRSKLDRLLARHRFAPIRDLVPALRAAAPRYTLG